MKTYVIRFTSFFSDEIAAKIIHSDKTKLEVLKEYLSKEQDVDNDDLENMNTVEDCEKYCLDEDFLCEIIEIPKI